MRRVLLLVALAACGGGDAKKAPDAGAAVGDVGPVTAAGAERVGGVALAIVDEVRAVVDTQALVDLAVEAGGYDGAITTRGAKLGVVPPGSIAARLGLAGGDVIAELGGRPVRELADLQDAWLALRRDGLLAVTVDRKGVRTERRLFLAELLDDPRALDPIRPDPDPVTVELVAALATGVRAGDPGEVDPKVLEVLGDDAVFERASRGRSRASGVAVFEGSPIEALGLTRWDAITTVDGRELHGASSLSRELALPRTELSLAIVRLRDPIVRRFRVVAGLVDQPRLDAAVAAWTKREADLAAVRAATAGTPSTPSTTPSVDWDPYVTKLDDSHFEVDRKLIDLVTADPMSIARGARIMPSSKNGQPNGLKLYAIRPSSVFSKLGLANGDTIHAVNGRALLTVDDLDAVAAEVARAKTIILDVTRRGAPVQLEYRIK